MSQWLTVAICSTLFGGVVDVCSVSCRSFPRFSVVLISAVIPLVLLLFWSIILRAGMWLCVVAIPCFEHFSQQGDTRLVGSRNQTVFSDFFTLLCRSDQNVLPNHFGFFVINHQIIYCWESCWLGCTTRTIRHLLELSWLCFLRCFYRRTVVFVFQVFFMRQNSFYRTSLVQFNQTAEGAIFQFMSIRNGYDMSLWTCSSIT